MPEFYFGTVMIFQSYTFSLQGLIYLLLSLLLHQKNKYLQKHILSLNDIFIKNLKFLAFYLRPPTVTSWKKETQHKIAKKLSSYADVCLCVLKLKQELSIKWLENIYLHCTLPKFYEIFLNVLMLLCFLMYQVCIQWYLVSYGCTYFHGRKEIVKSSFKYFKFLHAYRCCFPLRFLQTIQKFRAIRCTWYSDRKLS